MSKVYNNIQNIDGLQEKLKALPELEPIFKVLADASKVIQKRREFVAHNESEKIKLIAERDELSKQIEKANEECEFLTETELEEERDKVNLKIASIDAKLVKMENTPQITKEERDRLDTIIRNAYIEYVKHEAETVYKILEPLSGTYEENNEVIELVNKAFNVVQFELFRDNKTGAYSKRELWQNELNSIRYMKSIFDSGCIETLNKIKETGVL